MTARATASIAIETSSVIRQKPQSDIMPYSDAGICTSAFVSYKIHKPNIKIKTEKDRQFLLAQEPMPLNL